jgi:hypothetical protein
MKSIYIATALVVTIGYLALTNTGSLSQADTKSSEYIRWREDPKNVSGSNTNSPNSTLDEGKADEARAYARKMFSYAHKLTVAEEAEGPIGSYKIIRGESEPENRDFLRSIGLSEKDASQALDLMNKKALFSMGSLFDQHGLDLKAKLDRIIPDKLKLDEFDSALEQIVGPDNTKKIAYWEITSADRTTVKQFRAQLESQLMMLPQEKEQSIVDALHSARDGRVMSVLLLPESDRIKYIQKVVGKTASTLGSDWNVELEHFLLGHLRRKTWPESSKGK